MTLSSRRACPNMLLFGASFWYTCSGVLHVNLQAPLSPRSGHCDLGCSSQPCVRRCFPAPCVLFRSFQPRTSFVILATCNSQLGTGSQTKRRVKKTLLLYNIWAIPTLACSCPHTTIGPRRLNCRVRYGAGCFPPRYLHPEYLFTQEYIGK